MKQFSDILVFLLLYSASAVPLSARVIGVLYALESDWVAFTRASAGSEHSFETSGQTFEKIEIQDAKITFVGMKMGSGAVQSAVSTQMLVSSMRLDMVISIGPVGALSDDLEVGTLLVAEQVIPWQSVPHLESATPAQFSLIKPIPPPGDWSNTLHDLTSVSVASGEAFVDTTELRSTLRMATGADVVDMNLFGVLSCLNRNNVPSIHFRIVSDQADENAGDHFKRFREHDEGTLGQLLVNIIKNIPDDPSDPDIYPELKQLFDSSTLKEAVDDLHP